MKELKDFPGYFITEDGKVFSAKKTSSTNYDYNNLKKLKIYLDKGGYCRVALTKGSKSYYKPIHRLIAETYIDNNRNLPQVNHIDENKLNNHISNLEWVTAKQNIIHSKCRWIWIIENIVSGEIVEITNLSEFSQKNELDASALLKTLTEGRKKHKNFRIVSRTQFK